jgi:hypothetical protein
MGIKNERERMMRQIGDSFHFKSYAWEIVDQFQGGYALRRISRDKKLAYNYNGWVTENYRVFDINPNQPETIETKWEKICYRCHEKWYISHYCQMLNTPERVKARQRKSIAKSEVE